MAEEGDKQHHIAGVTRADVRGHFHHQGRQQAGTFGQAGTQHQGQDRPQRGKAAEVFNHIRQKPVQPFNAQQIFDNDHAAIGRIAGADVKGPQHGGGCRQDHNQINEKQERVRHFIADPFNPTIELAGWGMRRYG
ncbi:hypothetical protein D3C76_1264910 [compost metagenome]